MTTTESTTTTTINRPDLKSDTYYTDTAAFDLQAYIDSCNNDEKVTLFRNLGTYAQELEADGMWLEDHDTYPYTDEFMAWYVTNHYVKIVNRLLREEQEEGLWGVADLYFEYHSGRVRHIYTSPYWMCVQYDHLMKMTMKMNRINPAKVKTHLLVT